MSNQDTPRGDADDREDDAEGRSAHPGHPHKEAHRKHDEGGEVFPTVGSATPIGLDDSRASEA